LSGNNSNVSSVTKDANTTLLLNISVNNTGPVNAYSVNLSGMFTRLANATDTLVNWSFQQIQTITFINGSTLNLTTFNITIAPRSLGTYYFTPNATWTQPNGSIGVIWGPNLTIQVLSNPNFTVTASNMSLAIPHGFNQTIWFSVVPVGNDNITDYNITFFTPSYNFTVQFNHSSGSISLDESLNVSTNVSVNYAAISGARNFTVNVTAGNVSSEFEVNLTIPFNNSWTLNVNNITINSIATENGIDVQTLITHVGTADACLNFSLNLTGNMTAFSNLPSNRTYLNATQNNSVQINYTTPDNNNQYMGVLNLTETNSSLSQLVNVTFNAFTVEVHTLAINAPLQVLAGDPINITAQLIFAAQNQTENTTWSVFVDSTPCTVFSNTTSGNFSNINCTAPAVPDGRWHNITLKANFTNGVVYLAKNLTNGSAVFYRDITPPVFISEQSSDSELYGNVTLTVNATDNYQLANVTAQVTYPNGTVSNISLPYLPAFQLFNGSFNFTAVGFYTITYIANDTTGNSNSSLTGGFEMYLTRLFNGSILNLEGNDIFVNFSVRNTSESNLENFSTNNSGYYNKSLRAKWYELTLKFHYYNITVASVDFLSINQSFISIDNFTGSDISSQILGAKAGFAVITQMPSNGTLIIDYSPLLASITDETILQVYQCSNYTYSTRACVSPWGQVNSSTNTISNIITANFSSFSDNVSAFALVQYTVATPTPTTIIIPPSVGGGSSGGGGYSNPPTATPTPVPAPQENITRQIEELKNLLKQNKTEGIGLEPGVQSLTFELYPGESTQTSVHVKNSLNITSIINLALTGGIRSFVTLGVKEIKLGKLHEADFLVFASVQEGTRPGNFYGELQLANEVGKITIPVVVRVLEKREDRLLDIRLQPLVDTLDPGETLRIEINLFNLGEPRNINGEITLELVDPVTDEILARTSPESISLQTTFNSIKAIKIPPDTRNGRFVVRGILLYTVAGSKQREVSAISYFRVQASVWSSKLFGTLSLWQLLPLLMILIAFGLTYYRQYQIAQKRRRYIAKIDFTKLPEPGSRSGFIGIIAESKVRAFVSMDKLQTHTLIAGATGSGKTVGAQVIIEEALQKNTSVLVFDPTAQWTGFLRPQKNREMLGHFRAFGMNPDEARAFKGNIYVVRDPNMPLDIKKLMKPGEITVFAMNKLSLADHETFIANTIKQVFATGLVESPQLRLLLVYDEVHRLLTKFGGRGEGFVQIERGAREFRKWGVGMVLISQVLSDFVGEIKANIGTEIQMRTKYEGDLERLKLKYGEDAARSIVKESIGSGMVQNSEYNNGQPYFVTFRPLLHNVVRLSDTELSQYETYNDRVEKIEAEMEKLRMQGVDVLDLELEINLARDKVKKGAFNIVEIYIDSLEQKIASMKKKSSGRPERKIDFSDLGIGSLKESGSGPDAAQSIPLKRDAAGNKPIDEGEKAPDAGKDASGDQEKESGKSEGKKDVV
ncbi:MAG: DUF87 domain-containing protein, partial [Candidatus Micrarchaeota archaeon]